MKPQNVLFCCVMPITFVCSFVTLLGSFAQQAPDVRVGGIRRFGDLLREHNIELTEPALLGALKNPDSEVRFLAAMKLAEDKAIDAIPAVKRALTVEKIPRTRVNIAVALGLLGDPAGHDELKKVCADENVPPELRLYAVRYMFDLHFQKDEDCLGAAEEIVESKNTDFSNQIAALELLPMFQNLTARESQDALKLVLNCLEDPEPVVRMAASSALVSLGDSAAVPYLQIAVAHEQDENIRSVLETNLKKLQQKKD